MERVSEKSWRWSGTRGIRRKLPLTGKYLRPNFTEQPWCERSGLFFFVSLSLYLLSSLFFFLSFFLSPFPSLFFSPPLSFSTSSSLSLRRERNERKRRRKRKNKLITFCVSWVPNSYRCCTYKNTGLSSSTCQRLHQVISYLVNFASHLPLKVV